MWSAVPESAVGGREMLMPANLGYDPFPVVPRGQIVTAADETAHVLAQIPPRFDKIHVVGHSYGGLIGLHVLEALGPRAASAFFYEPVMFGALEREAKEPAAMAEAKSFTEHPWFATDDARGGTEPWLGMFIDYWNRPGSWQKMPEPMRALSIAAGWKMYQEVRAVFLTTRPFADWKIDVPTTLVRGERSTAAAREMAALLAHGRPNVTLRDLAGAPHMAPLTKPALVSEEISKHFTPMKTETPGSAS